MFNITWMLAKKIMEKWKLQSVENKRELTSRNAACTRLQFQSGIHVFVHLYAISMPQGESNNAISQTITCPCDSLRIDVQRCPYLQYQSVMSCVHTVAPWLPIEYGLWLTMDPHSTWNSLPGEFHHFQALWVHHLLRPKAPAAWLHGHFCSSLYVLEK